MVLSKVVKTELIELIRNAIVRGEFPAGTHLRLDNLAKRFAVSTMPIREALRELHAEGIVYSIPHRGSFVTRFTVAELLDIFEMRATLEKMATRDAVPRFTLAHFDEFQEMVNSWYIESDDIAVMVQRNADFHMLIYKTANRPHLYNEIILLRNRTRHYLHSYAKELGRFEKAKQAHQELVDAFKLGNAEKAADLMYEHVWNVGCELAEYVSKKDSE